MTMTPPGAAAINANASADRKIGFKAIDITFIRIGNDPRRYQLSPLMKPLMKGGAS